MDCGDTVMGEEGRGVGEEILRVWSRRGDEVEDREEEAGRENHPLLPRLQVGSQVRSATCEQLGQGT